MEAPRRQGLKCISVRSTKNSSLLIYLFGALGGLNWGYDTGVISAALVYLRRDFALDSWSEGGIVTALAVGAVLGAGVGGRLSDRYGRRVVLMITAVLFTIAPVGMALAPTTEVLFSFRLVVGLGTGLAAVVLPVYLSEMSPARIRGRVTAFYVLAIVIGQFLGFLIGVAFAPVESWRWMLGLSVIPSLLFALGLLAVRETPRWLVRQGREEEAHQLLLRDRTPEEASYELAEIHAVRMQEENDGVGGLRALRQPWVLSILLVGFGLGVYQQIMGINAVLYYAPTTLQNVGFSDEGAIGSNLIIGALNILAVWVAITYTDRWGRRPMLLVGAAGTAVSLAVLAAVNLTMPAPDGFGPLGIITLVCLGVFIFLFQVSWGALVWVVLGEIFPLGVRAAAMGVVTTAHWVANGLVSLLFPTVLAAFGVGWVFAGFALICATAFLFTLWKVPETKERSLEQIERTFRATAVKAA
ncbi:sugar porter family MFS transporter [Membranihabitans marinus]|uniref:Sugar porter family MFS transporter n=1 Tax=Nesterenkonia rhizosphaerae TaxID=1348272 RepID=A0ABP9FRG3_9MICC